MASQLLFFKKNLADQSVPGISATASNGAAYASNALGRARLSAWVTTGSNDATTETWTLTWLDNQSFSQIILNKHNFKSFTVKYWNGSAWTDFSAPISETTNTETTNRYSFTAVSTKQVQISVTTTQTVNADKYLFQFIATDVLAQLVGWPVIQAPTFTRNRVLKSMLSGKSMLTLNVGGYKATLTVKEWSNATDLTTVEALFSSTQGFLFWPCGGDEAQFKSVRQGYRLEDIFLMQCANDYVPEYADGQYQRGLKITMQLVEVTL